MPMTDVQMDRALDAIDEADPGQLGTIITDSLRRLGQHGREGAEALLRALESGHDSDVEEGLAQFSAAEGVLTGRTDAL